MGLWLREMQVKWCKWRALHGVDLTKFDGGAHVMCKFFLRWPWQRRLLS